MKWRYRINWKRKDKRFGGSLPGIYTRPEAIKLSKKLRGQYDDRLFWLGMVKSNPISKRDMVE